MQEIEEMQVRSLGWEDSLEEEMATHSGTLAWSGWSNVPETPTGLCFQDSHLSSHLPSLHPPNSSSILWQERGPQPLKVIPELCDTQNPKQEN